MSHASNKIRWCLNKAEKEIEECEKVGKRPKHRGLLKIEPNLEEAKKHIEKAEHNLLGITKFKNIGFSDWSITAGFYSLYHCFLAIGLYYGYESKNQTCTVALIEFLTEDGKININQNLINLLKERDIEEESIIEMREDYSYGIKLSVKDETKINEIIENCKELIEIAKNIVLK